MRSKLWIWLLFLVCGSSVLSGEPLFSAKAVSPGGKSIYRRGGKSPLVLVCQCPDTHLVGAWEATAYLRDIPEGFEKRPQFRVRAESDPRWSFVVTDQGRWFPEKHPLHKVVVHTPNGNLTDFDAVVNGKLCSDGTTVRKRSSFLWAERFPIPCGSTS